MPTIKQLDYPTVKLVMESTNPIEDAYRIHAVKKERWTVDFIESMPKGGVFWDVGANTGSYTLIAAALGYTVVALEPMFNSYAALCRNLAMNNLLDKCLALCLALGEKTGFDWMHYQDMRQGAASHVLGGERKQFFHRQVVPIWALDDLFLRLPLEPDRSHYVKLDVDGSELDVLKGATKCLQDLRWQGVMVEMRLEQETEIVALLGILGWVMKDRYNQRDGQEIANIAYGWFGRPPNIA